MRPDKIYLEEPLEIKGIKVCHTEQGLIYLIDHYETLLKVATPKQLSDVDREHIKTQLLANWKLHLELYKAQSK